MAIQLDYLSDYPALLSELAELNFNEWGHYKPGNTLAAQTERMRECCGKGSVPSVVIAHDGPQLLGGALLLVNDLPSRAEFTPWLAGVYVKEEHRGQGIASQLVQRIVEEARQIGVPQLYLCTVHAQALYAGLGWEVVEDVEEDDVVVTVMRRDTGA